MGIPDADLALRDRTARAMDIVRVEVVDGEGFVKLHFIDSSFMHSSNPLMFGGDAFDVTNWVARCANNLFRLGLDHLCVTRRTLRIVAQ